MILIVWINVCLGKMTGMAKDFSVLICYESWSLKLPFLKVLHCREPHIFLC